MTRNPYDAILNVAEDALGQGLRAFFGTVTAVTWPRATVTINGTAVSDILIACDPHPLVGDTAVVLLQGNTGFIVGRFYDDGNVKIGMNASAPGSNQDAVAIGLNAEATDYGGTAIGSGASAGGTAVAIGVAAWATETGVAVGYGAQGGNFADPGFYDAGENTTAVGRAAVAWEKRSTAVGYTARAERDYSTAVGEDSLASADYSLALGSNAGANGDRSFAIGRNAQSTIPDEGVVRCSPFRVQPATGITGSAVVMQSPDGNWWMVTVSNAGALTVVPYV